MSAFSRYMGRQFGNPHGVIGKICCLIMNVINKPMYKKTVESLNLNVSSYFLDIGYGNGYLLKRVYKRFGSNLFGIDISDDMKNLATKKNFKAQNDGKLNLFVGDVCHLDFDDNFFDAVSSINTIYFWGDVKKGLFEIHRCLKPSGKFYNVVYTKEKLDSLPFTRVGFTKFLPQQLVELGTEMGFSEVEVKQIVNKKSFVVIYTK